MSINNPLITVGIPTYNRPEGLRTTLERITNQSYKNLEIIISDNASNHEDEIKQIINEFSTKDKRIVFFRQNTNIGSIRNFQFLLNNAKGEYFLWAADDDVVDIEYIEVLLNCFIKNPNIVLAITGYDVFDTMSFPSIKTNLTKYIIQLPSDDTYTRMKKYILQPDHLGKSRLVWGMFKRDLMVQSFKDCYSYVLEKDKPIWSELPIEFRLLSYGDFMIDPQILFHVNLLPSSEGKKMGPSHGKKMLEICNRSFESLKIIINEASSLTNNEKRQLVLYLKLKNLKDKGEVLVYYTIERYFPKVARLIKQIVYRVS